MKSLPERIMEHAKALPEATPICPAALLHLGQRAAVGQALSRLARSGRLMRIRQGVYMRPIESRFGRCAGQPVGERLQRELQRQAQGRAVERGDLLLVGAGGRAGRAMEARVQYRPTPQRLRRLSPGP